MIIAEEVTILCDYGDGRPPVETPVVSVKCVDP